MKTTVGRLKKLVSEVVPRPMRGRERIGGPGSEWDEGPDDRNHLMCKCGGERVVPFGDGFVKCKDCGRTWYNLDEARGRVSPQEVMTTFEDLYMNSMQSGRKGDRSFQEPGKVSVEELASWIGVTPEQLMPVLRPAGLIVDRQGNVSPQGLTPSPMKAVKA
jgi:hypothetical protein